MTLNNNQVKFKLTKIKVYDERNFKKFVTSGFLGSCVHQVTWGAFLAPVWVHSYGYIWNIRDGQQFSAACLSRVTLPVEITSYI